MSNSSDKDKADWGNDTAPDAPYEVGNKKPPRAVQARFFWQSEGSPKGRVNLRTRVRQGLRKSIVVTKNGRPTRMPVLDVIANRLLESCRVKLFGLGRIGITRCRSGLNGLGDFCVYLLGPIGSGSARRSAPAIRRLR